MTLALEPAREAALATLRGSFACGHLGPATLEERVEAVLAAESPVELDDATWDLPARVPFWRRPRDPQALTLDAPPWTTLLLAPTTSARWVLGRVSLTLR